MIRNSFCAPPFFPRGITRSQASSSGRIHRRPRRSSATPRTTRRRSGRESLPLSPAVQEIDRPDTTPVSPAEANRAGQDATPATRAALSSRWLHTSAMSGPEPLCDRLPTSNVDDAADLPERDAQVIPSRRLTVVCTWVLHCEGLTAPDSWSRSRDSWSRITLTEGRDSRDQRTGRGTLRLRLQTRRQTTRAPPFARFPRSPARIGRTAGFAIPHHTVSCPRVT